MSIMGAILAGGRNTRYGGLKALAQVGGQRIIDRVITALRCATPDVVLIANDAVAYGMLGLDMRPDDTPTGGPLTGLLTALRWSAERGHDGILVVACDMPFANGPLLRRIAAVAHDDEFVDIVAPESDGRRGIEPLFAYYSTRCIHAIEQALALGDQRMIGFHDDVSRITVPLADVRRHGDPAVLFMNVNTQDELAAARRIAGDE